MPKKKITIDYKDLWLNEREQAIYDQGHSNGNLYGFVLGLIASVLIAGVVLIINNVLQ